MTNNKPAGKKQNGFTIVELLIVIVVIGILAAITIVSYSGITARANATKAQTNGVSVQKVVEAYNADVGRYPGLITEITGYTGFSKIPSGITVSTAAIVTGNGLTNILYEREGTAGAAIGGRITWWNFGATPAAVNYIYVGAGAAGDTFVSAV